MADVETTEKEIDDAGHVCFAAVKAADAAVATHSIGDQREVVLGMMMAASFVVLRYHGNDREISREMMHAAVDLCIDDIEVLPEPEAKH